MDSRLQRFRYRLPGLIVAGLSLFFAVAFGYLGFETLLSLEHGLPDQSVVLIAKGLIDGFDLAPSHVITVGAALGAMKLTIAGLFLLAATEKPPAVADGVWQGGYDSLDLALYAGIALTLLLLLPSWAAGDVAAVRLHMANLMLLAVAAAAGMVARQQETQPVSRVEQLVATGEVAAVASLARPSDGAPPV